MFTLNFLTLQSNWNQRRLPADNGPLFLAPDSLCVLGLTALLQAENCSKGDKPVAAQPGGSQGRQAVRAPTLTFFLPTLMSVHQSWV